MCCFPLSKAKEKYEKSLEELNKCTPQYMESMEQVFDQCQQHEVKRLTFLKEALLDIKRHLNLTENQRLVRIQTGGLSYCVVKWIPAGRICNGRTVDKRSALLPYNKELVINLWRLIRLKICI